MPSAFGVEILSFEKYRKAAFVLSVVLACLWMAYIFSFSAANATDSSEDSGRITETVVRVIARDYDKLSQEQQEAIFSLVETKVRKAAHFGLYTVLGALVACACFFCAETDKLKYVIGYLACFLYGASDELHQYLSPGRAPLVKDVFIDGAGSATGIAAVLLVLWIVKSKLKKQM